ncbi:MAG TPA: hypothetical protein VFP49_12365 [Nitrososphaeraceae archaeon]|nr:hypothetical protein [Nitrososphaeraceae archaeon]
MLKVDNNNSNFSYKIYSKWFVACIVVGFAILHSFILSLLASLAITLLMNVILNGDKIKIIMTKSNLIGHPKYQGIYKSLKKRQKRYR